jgi:peptide/nickel transport system permease protein
MRKLSWLTLAGIAAVGVVALAGPPLAPHPVDAVVGSPFAGPSPEARLGTDYLGYDVLSRLLSGGRDLVLVAALVALGATAGGVLLGLAAAVRGRITGWLVERGVEVLLALPAVLVLILIGAGVGEPSSWLMAGVLAVLGVPWVARVVVAAAQPVLRSGHVEHAVASGESTWWIVTRELAPNLRSTIATVVGLRFAGAIAVLAAAAFLHVGATPPEASWPLMVRENSPGLSLNPWAAVAPSIAIGVLATGATFLCDRHGRHRSGGGPARSLKAVDRTGSIGGAGDLGGVAAMGSEGTGRGPA